MGIYNMKFAGKLLTTVAILVGMTVPAFADGTNCPYQVKVAINKYKAKDYVGCIQSLDDFIEKDPSNAIAYYYKAIAYMKIGMKDEAIESFEKVSSINSVPVLSSYAVQATRCMNAGMTHCEYQKFSLEDINNLIADPEGFFEKKEHPENAEGGEGGENGEGAAEQPVVSPEEQSDIDMMIHGQYKKEGNVHPEANKVIQDVKLQQEQERVNAELRQRSKPRRPQTSDASEVVQGEKLALNDISDKEIADAVRTLSKAGYTFAAPDAKKDENKPNDYYKQMAEFYSLNKESQEMAMMFGGNNNRNNDSFNQMLPLLLMQEQQSKSGDGNGKKLDPELIKTMMMNSMMGDYDLGFDSKKDR